MRIIQPAKKRNSKLNTPDQSSESGAFSFEVSDCGFEGKSFEGKGFEGPPQGRIETLQAKASLIDGSVHEMKSERSSKKEFNKLMEKGVRLLAMREHSIKEMNDKLLAKTEQPDLVHAVIEELIANKYISNQRFTESYVRHRGNRGFGPVKIRSELSGKGINGQLIDEYLNPSAAFWYDNALAQYQKKYGDEAVSDYNAWTKRARFLQSRGFTMEHIQVTVPRVEFD